MILFSYCYFGLKIVTRYILWIPNFKYQYLEVCKCDICNFEKEINLSCSLLFNFAFARLHSKQTHMSKMICKCICVVILHFESWEFFSVLLCFTKEKVVILQWHSNDLKVIYSTHIFFLEFYTSRIPAFSSLGTLISWEESFRQYIWWAQHS